MFSGKCYNISIHSLRVEGDNAAAIVALAADNFNPLPPCGGRPRCCLPTAWRHQFQSTPSVWRETPRCNTTHRRKVFQSTPSVWRETLRESLCASVGAISIHSLRVEGDIPVCEIDDPAEPFQSTPSVWRETDPDVQAYLQEQFQSTPSVWRETAQQRLHRSKRRISIHSLRVEGDDPCHDTGQNPARNFNPLPPCGGRRKRFFCIVCIMHFNPLPPCGGRP